MRKITTITIIVLTAILALGTIAARADEARPTTSIISKQALGADAKAQCRRVTIYSQEYDDATGKPVPGTRKIVKQRICERIDNAKGGKN